MKPGKSEECNRRQRVPDGLVVGGRHMLRSSDGGNLLLPFLSVSLIFFLIFFSFC